MNKLGLSLCAGMGLVLVGCGNSQPVPAPQTGSAPAPVQAPAQPQVQAPAKPQAPVRAVSTSARDLIAATPQQASNARIQATYTPAYRSCLDRASSTSAMLACMDDELKTQDDRLNRAYVQVMRRLPEPENAQLRQVQRNWIRTRDQRCAAAGASGGTIDALNRMTCHVEMTISRTLEIEEIGSKV